MDPERNAPYLERDLDTFFSLSSLNMSGKLFLHSNNTTVADS